MTWKIFPNYTYEIVKLKIKKKTVTKRENEKGIHIQLAKSSKEENKNTLTLTCTTMKTNQWSEGEKERRKVYIHKGKWKPKAMGKPRKQITGKYCCTATLLISCTCTDPLSAHINKKFKPKVFKSTGKNPVLQEIFPNLHGLLGKTEFISCFFKLPC